METIKVAIRITEEIRIKLEEIKQYQALRAVAYQLAKKWFTFCSYLKKESPPIMVRLLFMYDKLLCLGQFVN